MKIAKITRVDSKRFKLHYVPNFLERIFGVKPIEKVFMDSGRIYSFSSRTIYIDEQGEKTLPHSSIASAIDKFLRVEEFNAQ